MEISTNKEVNFYLDPKNYKKISITKQWTSEQMFRLETFCCEMSKLHIEVISKINEKPLNVNCVEVQNLPIWIFVNYLTFGQLNQMVDFFGIQNEVLGEMNLNNKTHRNKYEILKTIKMWRNSVSHMEKISWRLSQIYVKTVSNFNDFIKILLLWNEESCDKLFNMLNKYDF